MSKNVLKLDKSIAYGEVHGQFGTAENQARFSQGGLYFDNDGNVLGEDHPFHAGTDAHKLITEAKKTAKARQAAKDAYAKEMADGNAAAADEMAELKGMERPDANKATDTTLQERMSSSQLIGTMSADDDDLAVGAGENMNASEKKAAATKAIIADLRGEKPLPFFQLKKVFEDGLGVKIMTRANAIEQAVEKGLLHADEVKQR